jgi:hypothetical protein
MFVLVLLISCDTVASKNAQSPTSLSARSRAPRATAVPALVCARNVGVLCVWVPLCPGGSEKRYTRNQLLVSYGMPSKPASFGVVASVPFVWLTTTSACTMPVPVLAIRWVAAVCA